ncbi:MAG: dienelactone hydrolase family protein [Chthoniobacter sp.]
MIVIPDADELPESVRHAASFAAEGWLVLAPALVDRHARWSGNEALSRFTNQPHREWIYRQSFEMGRTIIGYEAQKIFAALDALNAKGSPLSIPPERVGIAGYGEGGLLALTCAALDDRFKPPWSRAISTLTRNTSANPFIAMSSVCSVTSATRRWPLSWLRAHFS